MKKFLYAFIFAALLAVFLTAWFLSRASVPDLINYQGVQVNAEIEFFGKVLDEEGNPLPGVVVRGMIKVQATVEGKHATDEPVNATTDAAGLFQINNRRGSSVQIRTLKEGGYQYIPRIIDVFPYALAGEMHHPARSAPVVFEMCRERAAPSISEKTLPLKFSWNGETTRYDPVTGVEKSDGDLAIRALRRGYEGTAADLEWYVEISMKGGGVIPIGNIPTLLAPRDGYLETVSLGRGFKERKSFPYDGTIWLFVRSADQRYFLVELSLAFDSAPNARITGYLTIKRNLDNSRLLGKPQ